MRKIALAVLLAGTLINARWQGQAIAAELASDAVARDDQTVERLLQSTSVGVLRIDIQTLDEKNINKWVADVLHDADVPAVEIKESFDEVRGKIARYRDWRSGFLKAGGRRFYLVVNSPLLANPPYAVVPLKKGANSDAIAGELESAELLKLGSHAAPSTEPAVGQQAKEQEESRRASTVRAVKMGDAIVYGFQGTLDQLKPERRGKSPPEIAAALSTLQNSPIALAVATNEEVRKELHEDLMGKSKSVAMGIVPPPNPTVRATVRTADSAAASSARQDIIKKLEESRHKAGGTIAALEHSDFAVKILTPKLQAEQLVWSLDGEQFRTLLVDMIRTQRKSTTQPSNSGAGPPQ